ARTTRLSTAHSVHNSVICQESLQGFQLEVHGRSFGTTSRRAGSCRFRSTVARGLLKTGGPERSKLDTSGSWHLSRTRTNVLEAAGSRENLMTARRGNILITALVLLLTLVVWHRLSPVAFAQHPPAPVPPSLKTISVPLPSNLDEFVKNRAFAVVLGKALFWDMDVGSDRQACASCHFHAGADDRVKNQFNPGFPITADMSFGDAFGRTGSGAQAGPNYTAVAGDFPLHRLSNPED